MKPVPNPCKDCKPPQRHAYCHCEGQCAKGDAYLKFVEYRKWANNQEYMRNLQTASKARISKCDRKGNL